MQNAKAQVKNQKSEEFIQDTKYQVPDIENIPPVETAPDQEPLSNQNQTSDINLDLGDVKSNWPQLLIDIRPFNHSLSVLLSNCLPIKLSGAEITLATPYDFYRERLAEHKNKLTVEEVFSKILKVRVIINIIQDKAVIIKKDDAAPIAEKSGEQDSLLDSALQIMGGKVIEE